MKRMLFMVMLLPLAVLGQDKTAEQEWEGWKIADCNEHAIMELMKGAKGDLSGASEGRITENTKTIYIAKQTWLQNMPDSLNGIHIKYVDIPDNLNEIAKDVKNNDAAVYYISPFEMKSTMCELWVFPIDVKKGMGKAKQEYSTTSYKMNYFFNYDPPKYVYKGTESVTVE